MPADIGLTWACGRNGCDVDRFYNWEPSSYVTGVTDANVIGVEGALWSETVTNLREAEYLIFPRVLALAELGWSPKTERTASSPAYQDFLVRLAAQGTRLQAADTNFFPSSEVSWPLAGIGVVPDDNGNRTVQRALASVSAPGVAASAIGATIDWGDGTTSTGVVNGTAATSTSVNGLYTISGSHSYGPGHHDYSPTVTVTAPGKAPVTIQVVVRK